MGHAAATGRRGHRFAARRSTSSRSASGSSADDGEALLAGGFDGAYTYFATDGFTYGSTAANWPAMAAFARAHAWLLVPCVGPGYADLRVRPWNTANQRDRERGGYYDRQWEAALAARPPLVGVTSYNEWHEGTQIEPARPFAMAGFTYLDYGDLGSGWYLDRTRYYADRCARRP